jgi:hypothetical protein
MMVIVFGNKLYRIMLFVVFLMNFSFGKIMVIKSRDKDEVIINQYI